MSGEILRAAAAVSHRDRTRAVDGLREQLRVMAAAAAATPDWSTLTITGPTEVAGGDERAPLEWCASVVVHPVEVRSQ